MEIKATLQKPYEENEKLDFIVQYNHNLGYIIEETETELQALWHTEEELALKEKERIQALSMTRSDFFDGMIKAFGLDDEALLYALNIIVNNERFALSEIEKKISINNYKNALNFYRKHPLFEILSDVAIPTSETSVIGIDSEQWDKFFDETNKRNPDAYLYLKYKELPTDEPVEEQNDNSSDIQE